MLADSKFGASLSRFDAAWTRLESVLCAGVLALEVAAFTFWISLKGLSSTSSSANHAGLVFRAALGAIVLGVMANRVARSRPERARVALTLGASAIGLLLGRASANLGTGYFSNVLNWLQDSSSLTLLGGLRGVGTELTWWLAMLGASLATGSGRHINIDVVLRFLRPERRAMAVLAGFVTASVVCLAGVWGFFDHIAIESFGAPAEALPSEKTSMALREGGRHLFLLRKQLALDTKTVLHVLAGNPYDGWLRGAEWNAWVQDGAFREHFSEQQVRGILLPDTALTERHPPLVVVPSGENSRGLLTRDLHLVFPFGLLVIGIRFLLRALLVALGRADLDASLHSLVGTKPREDEAPSTEAGG
jgi:hypothetical protein